jgi:putative transposase
VWVPHDVRDLVVDFVRRWSERAEIGVGRFIDWLGVRASKFYDWRERYGRARPNPFIISLLIRRVLSSTSSGRIPSNVC